MELKVKTGYKKTEVGVIPEDWEIRSLKELCIKIQDGTHFSPKIGGNAYLYITSKNIGFGVLVLDNVDRIDEAQHRTIYKRCDVKNGDLLLTKDGANTGNAAINFLNEEFSLLSSVAFLRFDELQHTSKYYLQQILSGPGQRQIKEAMSGNAITRLTLEKINKLVFTSPKLPEQRAIATALSDVDALLESLDRLIAKKRDIKQATMQQLLTGKKRLPGFKGEWEFKQLGDVAEIVMGQSPSSSNYNTNGTGSPLIQGNADIYNRKTIKRIYTTQITKIGKKGDIIMSVRAPVGEISRASFDVCLGRGVCAIRFKNDFLYHYLIYIEPTWVRHSKGSTFDSVNFSDIVHLRLYLPSDSVEQIAIAEAISDIDSEISALEKRREKTKALKQAMMQELLTGRTRLV